VTRAQTHSFHVFNFLFFDRLGGRREKYNGPLAFPLVIDCDPFLAENLKDQIEITPKDKELALEANEKATKEREAREARKKERENATQNAAKNASKTTKDEKQKNENENKKTAAEKAKEDEWWRLNEVSEKRIKRTTSGETQEYDPAQCVVYTYEECKEMLLKEAGNTGLFFSFLFFYFVDFLHVQRRDVNYDKK